MAANPVMPYTFTGGTAAVAAEVNANLQTLVTWITDNAMQKDGSVAFTAVPSGPASDPTSANQLTRKAYVDATANVVGAMVMYGGVAAPGGWLLCQGQAVSRTTYSALFAVVGTAFGVGDGSTTFNLPDMRGRTPIGSGTGSGLTARTLGDQTVGAEDVTLTAAQSGLVGHNHTQNAHTHTQVAHTHTEIAHYHAEATPHSHAITQTYIATPRGTAAGVNTITAGGDTPFTVSGHGVTVGAAIGGGNENTTAVNNDTTAINVGVTAANAVSSHTNMQPSAVVNYIIKY